MHSLVCKLHTLCVCHLFWTTLNYSQLYSQEMNARNQVHMTLNIHTISWMTNHYAGLEIIFKSHVLMFTDYICKISLFIDALLMVH